MIQAFWLVLSITSLVGALNSATCTDHSFRWLYNTQDQTPCYVAEQVADVCGGGGLTLPPLDSGDVYFGPMLNQTNYCECSSIFYSLVSACAACQDRTWLRWSDFSHNCSRTWMSTFLGPPPENVIIPPYASINVTDDDSFNITAAHQVAAISGSASTSHSSKAGPIVGAVIACVAALAIAGALLFWYYRRRRRTMFDRLPKRRHYTSLSDPVTPAWTTYPQPVYQPEKRRESLNSTYLQMQSPSPEHN
ncbi:hypothetical protein AX14_013743 [Amanita brunnescens Koide BX004]|nr:hypothetical protein AX14_013743 [Amanita brunnescens Koide BX004]